MKGPSLPANRRISLHTNFNGYSWAIILLSGLILSACGSGSGTGSSSGSINAGGNPSTQSTDNSGSSQEAISAPVSMADTLRSCGNEFEPSCDPPDTDFWNGACDTGLLREVHRCDCLLHGPFGGCLIPLFCGSCVNYTRRRPSLNSFSGSWEDWALRNQRESLAKDEPINWVMHLGTHNSFNTVSDGHVPITTGVPVWAIGNIVDAPNQFYSMTDQMNTGARALAIDLHYVDGNARLCHTGGAAAAGVVCIYPQPLPPVFPGMRYYANGIKEIRNWLRNNPDQIIILDLENYVGCESGCFGDALFGTGPLHEYLGDITYPSQVDGAPTKQVNGEDVWPSRRDLLARGKQVVIIDKPVRDPLEFGEALVISGGDNKDALAANVQEYYPSCQSTSPPWTDQDGVVHTAPGPKVALKGQFSAVVEDRTLYGPFTHLGQLDPGDVAAAAQCNYSVIFLDFFSSTLPILGRDVDLPDFSRQKAAVWSWKENDLGQNGDCAKLEASSGRWVSAACSEEHRFACSLPRSESGSDPGLWRQLEDDWKVTAGAGPWSAGQEACSSEYPGYVFSVPVNGYQNRVLQDIQGSAGDLWLHYTDQEKNGAWEIPKLADINTPPVADAGPDQTIECGNTVTLDGSGSTDADGDSLTYTWTGPFGTLTGPVINAPLGAGTNTIALSVDDGKGGTDTDSVTITLNDTTPPTMTLSLSPNVLWPPNHRMVNVTAEVHVADACGDDQVLLQLVSIVSNEPENHKVEKDHDKGYGRHGDSDDDAHGSDRDGRYAGRNGPHDHDDDDFKPEKGPDIQEAEFGTGDLEFLLRAERSGKGHGRIYTVTYNATDLAGNTTVKSAEVKVPHDRKHRHNKMTKK
jgi:PKD domain